MRNKLLIVDDEELNRMLLGQIFEDRYEILYAGDGGEALELFNLNRRDLAAVLLDLVMPEVDGYEVLKILNAGGHTDKIPVILITARTDIETALTCYSIGAAEIINKPFVAAIVNRRVMNMIEMYASRERLKQMLNVSDKKLAEREQQLEDFNNHFVEAISDIVEFRNMESGQHVKRVMGFTRILADTYVKLYPECGLTDDQIRIIVKEAALHDIGKIVIPDSILLKPGRLTDEERRIMQSHTTMGCEILKKLKDTQDEEHRQVSYEIVRYHHERFDGKGYPDGLKGDEIPISARLVSLADVYDALVSERVYKKPFDKDTAFQMILDGKCGIFDPRLLECLKATKASMERFADSMAESDEED